MTCQKVWRPQQVWFGYSYEETDFSRNFCSLRIWMGWCLCILKQTWPPCPFKIQIATFLTVGSSLKLNKRWIVDSVSYVNFMQDLSTQSCFSCQSRGVFISEFINIFWKKFYSRWKTCQDPKHPEGDFKMIKKTACVLICKLTCMVIYVKQWTNAGQICQFLWLMPSRHLYATKYIED
jgi:hypothetical protein